MIVKANTMKYFLHIKNCSISIYEFSVIIFQMLLDHNTTMELSVFIKTSIVMRLLCIKNHSRITHYFLAIIIIMIIPILLNLITTLDVSCNPTTTSELSMISNIYISKITQHLLIGSSS